MGLGKDMKDRVSGDFWLLDTRLRDIKLPFECSLKLENVLHFK
jgi:hypothetical protein